MKEKLAFFSSILFILIAVSSTGCIDNPTNSTKTFQNENVSFNYSASWVTFSDFWPSAFGFDYSYALDENLNAREMVGVLDPDSSTPAEKFSTSVMIETITESGNGNLNGNGTWNSSTNQNLILKEKFDDTYTALAQQYTSSYRPISQRNFTLDGVIAYEKVYQIAQGEPYYQIRDIWLEKNNTIYIISCRSFPSNYNQSQNDFNLIINSFHMK